MKSINKILLVFFVSSLILIVSCTPERRVATKFLGNKEPIPILVIEPDYLFKTNHKAQYEIKDWDKKSEPEQDSLQISTSKFLKSLNDKTLISEFNNQLFNTLGKYPKLEIYNSSQMNEFLQKGAKGFIFNFTQVQLEEYLSLFRDSTYYSGRKYIQEFDRESVTSNFWIEITETNNPDSRMKVAFTSVHTYDKINGYFTYDLFTGNVKYNYNTDELKLNKIHGMINYAAIKNARLIFDYILNNQIEDKVIPNPNDEVYFHFDEGKKKLVRVYDGNYKYYFLDK